MTLISSRSLGKKSVTFDYEEEPVTSFQQRLKAFGAPPQMITPIDPQQFSTRYPSLFQQHSTGGSGRGDYARYEGGNRGRGRSLGGG